MQCGDSKIKRNQSHFYSQMKKCIQIIYPFLFCLILRGQVPSGYVFERWNSEKGFPYKSVADIKQAPNGNVWMLTDQGLCCFNGYSGRIYPSRKDSSGLLPFGLTKMFIDKKGIIWIGYKNSCISMFDPLTEKFKHFFHDPKNDKSFSDGIASEFLEDKRGDMWIAVWGGGLLKMNREKGEFKRFLPSKNDPNSVLTNEITSICELKDGRFMLGCWEGGEYFPVAFMGYFDPMTEKFRKFDIDNYLFDTPKELSDAKGAFKIVHRIYQEKNEDIWVATFVGLFHIDAKTRKIKRVMTEKVENFKNANIGGYYDCIRSCLFTDDVIWAGTEVSGIMHVNKKTLKTTFSSHKYSDLNSISSDRIRVIYKDKDDNIWVATTGEGVDVFVPLNQEFKMISNQRLKAGRTNRSQSLLSVSNVNYISSENKIYFSHGNGYTIYDPKCDSVESTISTQEIVEKNLLKFKLYPSSRSAWTQEISEYKDQLLIKLGGHVLLKKKNKDEIGFMSNRFLYRSLEMDNSGKILSFVYVPKLPFFEGVTNGRYLVKIDPSDLRVTDTIRLPGNNDPSLATISEKQIVAPLPKGNWFIYRNPSSFLIYNYHKNDFKWYSFYKPYLNFPDSMLEYLTTDSEGQVWIRGNNGVYRFNSEKGTTTNYTDKLKLNEPVLSITEDKNKVLWVALRFDLVRYDLKSGEVFRFNKYLGLNSGGFVQTVVKKEMTDKMYIPGIYGVILFDPSRLKVNKRRPSLFVSQIEINKDTLSVIETNNFLSGKSLLDWNKNNIGIEFASDQYYSSGPRTYSYRISGTDTSWTVTQFNRVAFSNLDPGKYKFELKCRNQSGVESFPLQFEFTISYPFWRSWWFICTIIALFIFIGNRYIKFRERRLVLHNAMLESKIEERTKDVIEKAKMIEVQKNMISEKNKELTDSIHYASRIQRSFLATKDDMDKYLSDYFIFFKPKDVVSGDFYWSASLDNGNFILVTADSTGHGVPGAIMSLLNITSIEKAIETTSQPSQILNTTRKIIIERLKKDGSAEGGKDGMDCSLISFDFKNNKLIYSAANNPVWIVKGNSIFEFDPDKMPVGKHDRDTVSFSQHEIEIQKDDVVYTITDGMPDQFGGPKGKKFMYKQLKELLISISKEPMEIQKQKISDAFYHWKGDLEQVDDVTLIGIRI